MSLFKLILVQDFKEKINLGCTITKVVPMIFLYHYFIQGKSYVSVNDKLEK